MPRIHLILVLLMIFAGASSASGANGWYIDGGFGFGKGYANSSFDAEDWCNSAGCVDGYWNTFDYPGSSQHTTLDRPTVSSGFVMIGKEVTELFSFGIYGNVGNVSGALGVYVEFGRKWLLSLGIGAARNSIFDKLALDVPVSLGYSFQLSEHVSLIPGVFFNFQWSTNGSATGQGYLDERGTPCYSCWAEGTENLFYYSGGAQATLRYKF